MTVATEAVGAAPEAGPDKRVQTETVLHDLLRLMGYPARLEVKDAADGGLSVAMHFEGEVPFAAAGKRSFVIDSMQFLVNKVVNRPNTERRWVSLGVGAHPEPRPARPANGPAAVPAVAAAAPAAAAPRGNGTATTPSAGAPPVARAKPPALPAARPAAAPNESTREVKPDPAMARLGTLLAEKSAKFGRYLGVGLMDLDDRTRLLQAAAQVSGQTAKVEGEGYNRRVVFTPDQPAPMPKKSALPVFDVEEDDEG